MEWTNRTVLVTGGTGSLGRRLVPRLLAAGVRKVIVFSRDELKQHEMRVAGLDGPAIRYFIGDVRDPDRLRRAFKGVDVIIHAAALKQVSACEYNPIEAILTNVMGARNVVEAALDCDVPRVMAVSTDKAVNPINVYGAGKLLAEKLFVQANSYRGGGRTRFGCTRYGNVVGSRGSVVPLFLEQRRQGQVTVTDRRMTRFWLTLDQAAQFVLNCTEQMQGGEIFIPKIPSMRIMDLVFALAPDCDIKEVGIRAGEKLHESLLSEEESRQAIEFDNHYVIEPAHPWWTPAAHDGGRPVPEGFKYTSDDNTDWLTVPQLQTAVERLEPDA